MQNETINPTPTTSTSTTVNNSKNSSEASTTSSPQNAASNGQLPSSTAPTSITSSTTTTKNSVNSSFLIRPTPASKFTHLDRFIEDYGKGDLLGEGTYGQVFKATHRDTKQIVAIKKIKVEKEKDLGFPVTAIREILILKALNHPNIVRLQEVVCSKDLKKNHFYMVFEYIEHDLAGLIYEKVTFSEANIKHLMKQLLEALFVCHAGNILHRDLKSSNLLIDKDGTLKLADFGLARLVSKDTKRGLTPGNRIVTLWYRPPECLLVSNQYDSAVDIWSAGCILAELLVGRPIFQGKKETEQLEIIWKICGTPEPSNYLCSLPAYQDFSPKEVWKRNLKETIMQLNPRARNFSPQLFDLLDKMLELDPKKRISAHECLDHAWFYDVKCQAQPPGALPPIRCSEMTAKERKKKEHQWGLSANNGGASLPPFQPSGSSVPQLQPTQQPIVQQPMHQQQQPNQAQQQGGNQDRYHQGGHDRHHHDGRKPYHHHNRGNYSRDNYSGPNQRDNQPRGDFHHDGHHRSGSYRREQQNRDQHYQQNREHQNRDQSQSQHPQHQQQQQVQHSHTSTSHSSASQSVATSTASTTHPTATTVAPTDVGPASINSTVHPPPPSQPTGSHPPPPPPSSSAPNNPPPPPTATSTHGPPFTPQKPHHHHQHSDIRDRESRDNRDRNSYHGSGRKDNGPSRDYRDDRSRDSGRERDFRDNGPSRDYRDRPEGRDRSEITRDKEREGREAKDASNSREHRVETRERSDSRDYGRESRHSGPPLPNSDNPAYKRQKSDSGGYYERREGRHDDHRDDDYRRKDKYYTQPRNNSTSDRKPDEKRDSRK